MSGTFGENVRKRRLELGMTLQEVADVIDSSKGYVWEIENKDKGIGLERACRLAKLFKTNVYGLLGVATPRR